LVTRETLEEVGLHRTDFQIRGEDFEFSLRISARHKAIYVPDARLTHYCFSGPFTPEAIASERKKQIAMLHNVAYIACRLPHGLRILRCLPGNLWRHCKNWGLGGLPEGLLAYWKGGILGCPAGEVTLPPREFVAFPDAQPPCVPVSRQDEKSPLKGAPESMEPVPDGATAGPIKILQIFGRYLQYGGEEGSVYRIGDALMKNHQIEYYLKSSADLLDGGSLSKIKALPKVLHSIQSARDVRRMQEVEKFDIWQIHNVFPALSPSIYEEAFRLKVPTLHYLHNYRMGCINGFFLDHGKMCQRCMHGNFLHAVRAKCWQESRLACGWMGLVMQRVRALDVFHQITRWVAISEAQKKVHVEMGIPSDRIDVIHHFYEPKAPPLPLPENGYALFLGRLSVEKGCMDLIKAWKAMPPGRTLVIAGTGPELPALEAQVAAEGLTNVHFAGFVRHEQQEELWRGAAFLVVPSIWLEPFGMVVLEAWSYGRTVIAYSMGALPELITHEKTGLLVEPFNTNALAAGMEKLFANPDWLAALSVAARQELETRFSEAAWLCKIEATYAKVLSSRP
jgi:glycosyltransferase involved in cell wall biosynthesis